MTPTVEGDKINMIKYNRKTSQLLLKNNAAPPATSLKRSSVIYEFTFLVEGCHHSYIRMTTTKLSKSLSCHLQEAAIFNYYAQKHQRRPEREELVKSTKI